MREPDMRLRLLTALALSVPLLAAAACARPWRVPFEEWRPYSFIDAEGRHTGLETELLAAVAKEMDCSVAYVHQLPRNRRLLMLASGQLDLLVAASNDPESAEIAWFTRPYRHEEFAAFSLANDAKVTPAAGRSLAGLLEARLHLLAHRGPSVVPIVDQFGASGLLTQFEDYAKGVQLLKLGRGDVLIGDRLAVLFAARADGVALTELPMPVLQDVVAYKLSRKRFSEDDLARFNEAIQRLDATGELRRIRRRWLP